MTTPLQIGIVGAGRIGIVHARTVAFRVPEAQVAAIADPNLEAARRLATELGVARVGSDYREMLDDPKLAALVVCSSTDTHAEVVMAAARAGKHLFCEKPLDLELGKIDHALAAVEAAGVKLQLGFNRRFDPDFAEMQARVRAGAIGSPHLLRITSRDPAPPAAAYVRVSGGMFLDMTIHDFDMARFLCGEVEEIYAVAANLVDPALGQAGDVDTALLTLRFASGALGCIDNSRQAVYGYDQRVEIFGDKGMLANHNRTAHSVLTADSRGIRHPLPLDFFMQRYADAYEAEIRAFVRAITRDEPVPVTGHDARQATLLGYAAKKSVAERRPVRLEEIERPSR
jgi:myo-inositol 2-dehydrogenase/D-chiro-inositol 1-dehydrogenase